MATGWLQEDPRISFPQVSLGQDWMVFHDAIQTQILHTQTYSPTVFLPYLTVAFHFLFAAPTRPQIKYPHTSYEVSIDIYVYCDSRPQTAHPMLAMSLVQTYIHTPDLRSDTAHQLCSHTCTHLHTTYPIPVMRLLHGHTYLQTTHPILAMRVVLTRSSVYACQYSSLQHVCTCMYIYTL